MIDDADRRKAPQDKSARLCNKETCVFENTGGRMALVTGTFTHCKADTGVSENADRRRRRALRNKPLKTAATALAYLLQEGTQENTCENFKYKTSDT